MARERSIEKLVFDHYTLRLLVGSIAFSFPFVVYIRASAITSSISASYYTDARDIFVGFLFVIGALLLGYKGHSNREELVSLTGWVAAWLTALFPTACDDCPYDIKAFVHTGGAIILFSTTVYFCLIAFMRRVNQKLMGNEELAINEPSTKILREVVRFLRLMNKAIKVYGLKKAWVLEGDKLQRGLTYLACGSLIALIMIGLILMSFTLPAPAKALKLTFYAETFALWLFGIAWIKASQIPFIHKLWQALKRGLMLKRDIQQTA